MFGSHQISDSDFISAIGSHSSKDGADNWNAGRRFDIRLVLLQGIADVVKMAFMWI